jgi:HEPN domain-containing protein
MDRPDPRRQAEEASRWVARADRDIAAARRAIAIEPRLTDDAAYHCQQATEKLLKAALILAAVRPRKTHDLAALADAVAAVHPGLAPLAQPLRPRSIWAHAFRYPLAQGEEEPEPSVAEIEQVLDQVEALRAAVARLIEASP